MASLLAYASDHKGYLPYGYDDTQKDSAGKAIVSTYPRTLVHLGYVTDPSIFFNPSRPKWYLNIGALRSPHLSASVPWFYTNYGGNRHGALPYKEGNYRQVNTVRVANDGNLSKLMVLRDTYQASYDEGERSYGGGILWFNGNGNLPPKEKTFGGLIHAAFCDGHVETFHLDDYLNRFKGIDATKAPFFQKIYTQN